MSSQAIVVKGFVKPDGTLELQEKLPLPAGDVEVTVLPLAKSPDPERFWKMMEGIWSDLQTSGRTPRTKEQIDAEIEQLRQEAEDEMQAVERLHQQCRSSQQNSKDVP